MNSLVIKCAPAGGYQALEILKLVAEGELAPDSGKPRAASGATAEEWLLITRVT